VLSAQEIGRGTYNWEERRKKREAMAKKKGPAKKTAKKKSPAKKKAVAKKKPAKKKAKAAVTADGRKTTRKDGKDDLKLIYGIGPVYEKLLNKNKVTTFEHIARWKKADIEKYAELLGGFSDRIEREEWVKSAKQIIAGTYNWQERVTAMKKLMAKSNKK